MTRPETSGNGTEMGGVGNRNLDCYGITEEYPKKIVWSNIS
jgi:hypothetical protein